MGHTVYRPSQEHVCDPGWTYKDAPEGSFPFGAGRYGIPPGPREFPKGTIWQCDCGRTWVSTGPIADNTPGFVDFRPERRGERRRREREVMR